MTAYPDEPANLIAGFEVGVALTPLGLELAGSADSAERSESDGVPGYEDLIGGKRTSVLFEKGEQFVNSATEALATQIAKSADHIARVINEQVSAQPRPGLMELESVDVSFGVTLSSGIQAMFTAQADSSAMVTISLRRRGDSPPSAPAKKSE